MELMAPALFFCLFPDFVAFQVRDRGKGLIAPSLFFVLRFGLPEPHSLLRVFTFDGANEAVMYNTGIRLSS